MFFNLSLFYLNVQYFSSSPLIITSPSFNQVSNNFGNLHINNFFTTFYYTNRFKPNYYVNSLLFVKKSLFTNLLGNTIIISTFDECKNDTIFNVQLPIPPACDKVILNNCCFSNCMNTPTTYFDGSAIHISISWCELHITSCIFVNCTTTGYGGAICTEGHGFNVTSSIFTECSCDETGMAIYSNYFKRPTTTYMFSYYQETLFTKCQGKSDVLDVNTTQIRISTSNITYNSNRDHNPASSIQQNCCGIPFFLQEYRLEFTYMNFIGNDGDFLINFDQKPDGNIHSVNIISNINLNYFFFFDDLKPLQFPSQTLMNLTNFAFFNNKPRSELDGIKIVNRNSLMNFILFDCVFDYSKDQLNVVLDGQTESGGQFDLSLSQNGGGYTYTQISLLVKPSICAIPSDPFTPSSTFSDSDLFSSSEIFSLSKKFTKSDGFSSSNIFSSSKLFSNSFVFSKSSIFPPSLKFSSSDKFSFSEMFSLSTFFTCSIHFSNSDSFSPSLSFNPSFTFSKSNRFSQSFGFSISNEFTESEIFSITSDFSKSIIFSCSDSFSPSFIVLPFSQSFSESNSFIIVNPTGTFTSSNSFTPSMFFTPNKTKIPDPQNIFHRAEIGGKNDIFTKEEFKKAAAPVSISFTIIIVAIVLTVFYLKRKLNEIKHQDDVPDFDDSFKDETDVDSEYSYSYYTYSYCYSSSECNSSQKSDKNDENTMNDDDSYYSEFTTDDIVYDDYFSDVW